ncbi:hypothetical protein D9757_010156 [Collybiopsis confluens]|uniref:Uncharacterized protein n=1 Tax=Collybiopsis confluens TaxID=2823264 RepID=A0A8H5H0G7_9AGAR|nr:hypothetical protein D9757_010156 [Collybiopsis confluens]
MVKDLFQITLIDPSILVMIYQLKRLFELLDLGRLEKGEYARWFSSCSALLGFGEFGGEVGSLVRRAKSNRDCKSSQRRTALQQLVSSIHPTSSSPNSPNSIQTKTFAAIHIPTFFPDFPDLSEEAINALYDLCEDSSIKVRLEGYRALGSVSKLGDKKWIKRNADVLVQLLQSEEMNEVAMVKKMLVEHLQLDAQVTLGVLCDQVVQTQTLEQGLDGDGSLRGLVLGFIKSQVGKEYRSKYITAAEAEPVLVDGLLNAIPKLEEAEGQNAEQDILTIINDILINLPFIDSPSPQGKFLASLALSYAKKYLAEDLSLTKTLPYLPCLSTLFIHKKQGDPLDLLTMTFYPSIVGNKNVFARLEGDAKAQVCFYFVEVLSVCQGDAALRVLGLLAGTVFDALGKMDLGRERERKTCVMLLRRLGQAVNSGWKIPTHILSGAQKLKKKEGSTGQQEVDELIKALVVSASEAKTKELSPTVAELASTLVSAPVPASAAASAPTIPVSTLAPVPSTSTLFPFSSALSSSSSSPAPPSSSFPPSSSSSTALLHGRKRPSAASALDGYDDPEGQEQEKGQRREKEQFTSASTKTMTTSPSFSSNRPLSPESVIGQERPTKRFKRGGGGGGDGDGGWAKPTLLSRISEVRDTGMGVPENVRGQEAQHLFGIVPLTIKGRALVGIGMGTGPGTGTSGTNLLNGSSPAPTSAHGTKTIFSRIEAAEGARNRNRPHPRASSPLSFTANASVGEGVISRKGSANFRPHRGGGEGGGRQYSGGTKKEGKSSPSALLRPSPPMTTAKTGATLSIKGAAGRLESGTHKNTNASVDPNGMSLMSRLS